MPQKEPFSVFSSFNPQSIVVAVANVIPDTAR